MRTNRRKFFAKAGASAAALTLATSQGAAAAQTQTRTRASGLDKDGPILKIGDNIAVADTAYGKVRGDAPAAASAEPVRRDARNRPRRWDLTRGRAAEILAFSQT